MGEKSFENGGWECKQQALCISSEGNGRISWSQLSLNPFLMLLSMIFSSILQVKSVLDPCEDDNEGIQDDMSAGDDSMQQNEYYDTDSEVNEHIACYSH